MTPAIPTTTLSSGTTLPLVGFGTYQTEPSAIKAALDAGYRHLDSAHWYRNEKVIGDTIKQSGIPRSQLFLTSKVWPDKVDDPELSLRETLANLGTDYVDLLLVHWPLKLDDDSYNFPNPQPVDIAAVWKKFEAIHESGRAKAIGVSNFSSALLEELLHTARIKPAVHQIEVHPYLQQNKLHALCNKHGIHITAYSSLGSIFDNPKLTDDPVIVGIAAKHGVAASTVLLSWGVQRGMSVIPRSNTPERIVQNLKTITLDQEDMDIIAAIKTHVRYIDPIKVPPHLTHLTYDD